MQDDIGEPIVPKCFFLTDIIRRYKKHRRDIELFENRKCTEIIIVKTVIESNDDRLGRKWGLVIQRLYQIGEGNRGEVPLYVLHLPDKIFHRCANQFDIEWKTGFVRHIAYAVIGEYWELV